MTLVNLYSFAMLNYKKWIEPCNSGSFFLYFTQKQQRPLWKSET